MAGQKPQRKYRRCIAYNRKSHHRDWKGDKGKECPLCGESVGYYGSTHGGLTRRELRRLERESSPPWVVREREIPL